MRPPATLLPLTIAGLLTLACGEDTSRNAAPPARQLETAAPADVRGSVSADLAEGTCEPVSGTILNRPALHGAMLTIETRQILVLLADDGRLRFYRDQVIGRTGYNVRLDAETDSAFVLDRETRKLARGSVADFLERPDLGPPAALANQVLQLCGMPAAR